MLVTEIQFEIDTPENSETQHDEIQWLWGTYRMDGHTLGRESPVAQQADRFIVFTLIPAEDALDTATFNKHIQERLQKLSLVGLSQPIFNILGKDPSESSACVCSEPSAFILFTTYLTLQSPLRCASCFSPVPLYRIPRFPSEDFHDIISWQSDYQSCDSLQMNCSTGERFATRQLSSYDSSLTQRGLQICKEIEKLTGKPVYYYLYRGTGKSHKGGMERKCRHCGGEWLLKEPWHKLFDFRCDKCRLLSNIEWSFKP
jgi:predicted  nucleic acid-binding Zn ribbon protein